MEENKTPSYIIIGIIILTLAILAFLVLRFGLKRPPEKGGVEEPVTMETVIKSLTAPESAKAQDNKNALKLITAPKKTGVRISQEVLNSLTAPTKPR